MKITRATVSTLLSCAGAFALSSCGGGGGNAYNAPPNPTPAVSFSTPTQATSTIHLGETATLTWSALYATSCSASASSSTGGAFTGTQATSGHVTVAPTAQGSFTYTLSCMGAGGMGSGTATVTVGPGLLSTLTQFTQIGSTVDPKVPAGGNPYGLAIAPVTSGLVTQNDLIICNFNDFSSNTAPTGQGSGTTVVGIHPTAGSTPYEIAHASTLAGCNALTVLPDDSIVTADWTANNLELVSSAGAVSNPFSSQTFTQPWGATYAPAAGSNSAALYVTNYGTGGVASIDRIELNTDSPTNFTEIAKGFCGSGAPGAIYAPAGLTYDASIDTLYIVDTSSNSVVAFAGVSQIGTDGVVVAGGCGGTTYPTPALTFSGPSASSARVVATGGMFNGPISAALLSNHDLIVGNGDVNAGTTIPPNLAFEISPAIGFVGGPVTLDNSGTAGALFGIATTVDSNNNQIVYFNDDVTSTVYSMTVPPSATTPAPTPMPPTYTIAP